MSCCRDFHVVRVIASRTGYVSIPTDCRTSNSLRIVMYFIVTKRCNITDFIVIAILTISALRSLCQTSGSECFYPFPITMSVCCNLNICCIIATRAGFVSVPTNLSAGRSFCIVVNNIVTRGNFCFFHTAVFTCVQNNTIILTNRKFFNYFLLPRMSI